MSPQTVSLMVGTDHAVSVNPQGGQAVVTVDQTGGTIFYADNQQVSAASNQGMIAPGGSQTFTAVTWLRGSALAGVLVMITPGSGMQTLRVNAGAFTAGQAREIPVAWPYPFNDTNYTVSATLYETVDTLNNSAVRCLLSQTVTGVTVRVGSGPIGYSSGQLFIHLIAIHD